MSSTTSWRGRCAGSEPRLRCGGLLRRSLVFSGAFASSSAACSAASCSRSPTASSSWSGVSCSGAGHCPAPAEPVPQQAQDERLQLLVLGCQLIQLRDSADDVAQHLLQGCVVVGKGIEIDRHIGIMAESDASPASRYSAASPFLSLPAQACGSVPARATRSLPSAWPAAPPSAKPRRCPSSARRSSHLPTP